MTPEDWERAARLLKAGPISTTAAAARLGLSRWFVARVRADLGMEPFLKIRREGWTQADYDEFAVRVRGGHRVWRGRYSKKDGVPRAGRSQTAYQLAFRLHHGRPAVGPVRPTCTRKRCVEGAHLRDDVLRAAQLDAASLTELPSGVTWQGMDLVAIRGALAARAVAPYPPLNWPERKLAFRFRDPEMSVADLARRFGCSPRTMLRWRDKGVPS